MVLIGLLLLALVCLALGLVLTSSAWLIASLIASAGAGLLLWRMGSSVAVKPARKTHPAQEAVATPEAPTTFLPPVSAGNAADPDVWVIDGRPRFHLESCAIIKGQDAEPIPYSQATEDGFMPCSLCEPNASRTIAS